jgi:acetyltransferase-like isoleucine patch superfamily enzyme
MGIVIRLLFRLIFYLIKMLAFIFRAFGRKTYMFFIVLAHKSQGVKFIGKPEYIQNDAYLDPSGGLTICKSSVISTHVIILTHDWSFLKRKLSDMNCINEMAFKNVFIDENSFIGAGAIILPGSHIGKNCIIGAGALIKGNIEDFAIVAGNPAKKIGDTRS